MNEPMMVSEQLTWSHGGVDAQGVARFDFSTNSNACGPCPFALEQVQQADPSRYPDPHYTQLQAALAQWHGVAAEQVVLGGSASELIHRLQLAALLRGATATCVPQPAYGDYARHAQALGIAVQRRPVLMGASLPLAKDTEQTPVMHGLEWVCSPSSPHGVHDTRLCEWQDTQALGAERAWWRVLDAAYAPLELLDDGMAWHAAAQARQSLCWQLFSPNKALGLTGVRAAYAIAPCKPSHANGAQAWQKGMWQLKALAPSWPVGAHGVALLEAWMAVPVQEWLHNARAQLRVWKQSQMAMLQTMGWHVQEASVANYCVAEPAWPRAVREAQDPLHARHALLAHMRAQGVKLRETDSMGLPGHVRLSVQSPVAQSALAQAWRQALASFA
ncbi:aminotransferase class I/II-fold pyridoxal phosphate-dependent enzyme [Lampropedia puyangensis]|uniref:Aminotransferase class I/II-fold pyridoxal phosphate-dependent enzyme n=1 Tax=Lampropedia puyangensis TaxID=1330072 RepID=A0A4S8FDP2_9BURK|nr:aminotransferase class I/II-fold pyridoxal phosphate-dependent enzyme [Lampropedia puyangensis]THU05241.1 aminotransferase class I/II-fold pyridoxal phosphate-dependent enzyme [Lampropedia puyangensis]